MFGVNISVPRTQLGTMRAQPLRESFARNFTGGESEHEALLIVNRGAKLHAVHDEEHFRGSMRYAFVAVDESVIADEGIAECGSLIHQAREASSPPTDTFG